MKFNVSEPLILNRAEEIKYAIKIVDFHSDLKWVESFQELSWNFENIQIEYFGGFDQAEAPNKILTQLTDFIERQKKEDNYIGVKYWFLGLSEGLINALVDLESDAQDELAYIAPDLKGLLALQSSKAIQKINIGYQSVLLNREQEQYLEEDSRNQIKHYRLGDFFQQSIHRIEPFIRMKKTLLFDTQVVKQSEFGEKPSLTRINGLTIAQFLQIGAYAGMSLRAKNFIFPHLGSNISEINSLILQFIWYYCQSLTFNIYEDITIESHYSTYKSLLGGDLVQYKKHKITSRWWLVTENGWLPVYRSKDRTE